MFIDYPAWTSSLRRKSRSKDGFVQGLIMNLPLFGFFALEYRMDSLQK